MTGAWWGKEATSAERRTPVASAVPELVTATADAVFEEVSGRVGSFAKEWTSRRSDDAGVALTRLFSEEMEPVLQRLNQLPQKSFVEFLRTAGVQPFPATPAHALLQFSVSDKTTQPVQVPQGFQVQAPPANGGDPVIFETDNNLSAVPSDIQGIYAVAKGLFRAIDPSKDDVPFQPFGDKPRPGFALFIAFSGDPDANMGSQLSLGVQVQGPAGQPPPVSTGGVTPLPTPLSPLLQWDALDRSLYRPLEVISDATEGLLQSGVVSLRLPQSWAPGIPQGAPDTEPLRWLRLQIASGGYGRPPVLLFVKPNMVAATAAQSFYNEVLTALPGTGGSVWLLSRTPVLAKSLVLSVDDTADISFDPSPAASPSSASPVVSLSARDWKLVDDLADFGPEDEVYVLDPSTGQVSFGDGLHGRAVPQGFRNIVARKYQVGSGSAGAVAAGKASNPVNSVPFLSEVTNPMAASGGTDAETQEQARLRGPREIRARGRAVALADYEVLALHAEGAQVARAHAVGGFHPAFPGVPIAGVVCVFVVSPKRGGGSPTPDEQTLAAVSEYLSDSLAPGGVEIVAAAPRFHRVRVQTSVLIDAAANPGVVVRDVLDLLDAYLDPIDGGDDEQGWPFGGTLSYLATVRRILAKIPAVKAVDRLNFVVDGVRGDICQDFPISPNSLVWPAGHEVIANVAGGAS